MNTKKIHLQSKCTTQVERKKEKRQTVNYLQKSVNSKSTKWQEQQISANPASTLGPSSAMMMELSNICFVLVFECGRPGLQSSTLPLSVHPSRGGRSWIELSENDKSVPLGPVFQLNMQNKSNLID